MCELGLTGSRSDRNLGVNQQNFGLDVLTSATDSYSYCDVNCRLNAFVCGNINVWNRLPAHVVNSDSVAVFKHRLTYVNLVNGCS